MIEIETIQTVNRILSYFGLLAILGAVFLIVDLLGEQKLRTIVNRWGMHAALAITVAATGMSLVYSDVFGLIPCGFCWLERMMLFPQILLISTALYFKDKMFPVYGIGLSVFGFIVSVYHHYLQMGGSAFISCPAAGAGADCAKRFFYEFGFMTFPLLSGILFAFLIALYIYIYKTRTV